MVNFLKFQTLFSLFLLNKMLVFRAGIHKMLFRISNSEDLVQKQSDMGLHCLSRPLCWQASSVRNFKTFTVL